MNEIMVQFFQYMVAYGGLICLLFFSLNFLTKGFILNFIRVKSSQGKLTLSRIHSVTDTYYKVGKWEEDFFTFKNRQKEAKKIAINDSEFRGFFAREMGINVVDVDENGCSFFNTDYKQVVKFANIDPGRTESLFLRIKNRPLIASKKETLIIILILLIVVMVGFAVFKQLKLEEALVAISQISGNI